MTKEALPELKALQGRLITEVREEADGYTLFAGDLALKLEGCPYNDARCERCSCDKNKFRVSLADC